MYRYAQPCSNWLVSVSTVQVTWIKKLLAMLTFCTRICCLESAAKCSLYAFSLIFSSALQSIARTLHVKLSYRAVIRSSHSTKPHVDSEKLTFHCQRQVNTSAGPKCRRHGSTFSECWRLVIFAPILLDFGAVQIIWSVTHSLNFCLPYPVYPQPKPMFCLLNIMAVKQVCRSSNRPTLDFPL